MSVRSATLSVFLLALCMNESPKLLPSQLSEDGWKAFVASGNESRSRLIDFCGLKPDEDVLDVGCGAGRVALALSSYLTSSGSYEGFDVLGPKIDWCASHISSRHPNFQFQAVDVYSKVYNRKGDIEDTEYRFPYADQRFDLVFLFSVFTHILPGGFQQYLSEIARVLRPGGRCLATMLLLNEDSLALIEKDETRTDPGINSLDSRFSHDLGGYRLGDPDRPEKVVAYDEQFALQAFERTGLRVREPINYGWWPGRDRNGRTRQDYVVADASS